MKRLPLTINISPPIVYFHLFLRKANVFIFKCDKKLGIVFTGLLLSIILFCCAGIYIRPNFSLFKFGTYYAQVASDPFNFDGDFRQFRILTPLIGYIVNLHGNNFIFLPLLIGVFFLSIVYIYFRKIKMQPISRVGITTIIAFSCPFILIFFFQGYPDITSNLLLFLSYVFIKKPYWFIFYCLSLFNHENNIFIAPALLLLAIDEKNIRKDIWRVILFLILAILPVLFFRYYIIHLDKSANIFANSYLKWDNIVYCIRNNLVTLHIGLFHSYKLFWIIPLYSTIMLIHQKRFFELARIWIFIIAPMVQIIIAVDINRLMELAFPAFLLSFQYLYRESRKHEFNMMLWLLITINLFVPEVIVVSPLILERPIFPIYVIQHLFYKYLMVP